MPHVRTQHLHLDSLLYYEAICALYLVNSPEKIMQAGQIGRCKVWSDVSGSLLLINEV